MMSSTSSAARVMICIPCLLVGGTEIHTKLLARALIGGGYRVCVCVYYEFDLMMVEAIEATGAQVRLLRLERKTARGDVTRTPRLLGALAREMRAYRPQFVHVQYMTPGIAPLAMAKMLGVPHVLATIHVTANHYKYIWLPRDFARKLCDVVLCVSHVAERSFFGSSATFCDGLLKLGRRHFTISNGVDLAAIDSIMAEEARRELACDLKPGAHPIVGIVGRLDRFKGHDLLLRAFELVRRNHPEALLLIVGDGPERERLTTLASELRLSAHVTFTGRLPQMQALGHMASMDVVAMPSRPGLEGFGLSAAEALAMGKPLVASDVDGLAEVVGRHGAGVLVPPENVPALAGAIDRLLSDPPLREKLGTAGRRRVEQQFSVELFARRHLELYSRLATSQRRASRNSATSPAAASALQI